MISYVSKMPGCVFNGGAFNEGHYFRRAHEVMIVSDCAPMSPRLGSGVLITPHWNVLPAPSVEDKAKNWKVSSETDDVNT